MNGEGSFKDCCIEDNYIDIDCSKHLSETMGHYVVSKCDSRYISYDLTNSSKGQTAYRVVRW